MEDICYFPKIQILRRPLPVSIMVNLQTAFVSLLLLFIVYVTFFDLRRIQLIPTARNRHRSSVETTETP